MYSLRLNPGHAFQLGGQPFQFGNAIALETIDKDIFFVHDYFVLRVSRLEKSGFRRWKQVSARSGSQE